MRMTDWDCKGMRLVVVCSPGVGKLEARMPGTRAQQTMQTMLLGPMQQCLCYVERACSNPARTCIA